jgi:phenylpropionate dioxygenase-like ring-hydroxylating dioxygenase large terminal subunit
MNERRAAECQNMRRRMMQHLKQGTTDLASEPLRIPAGFYTDPDRLVRERERIFYEQPLLAALSQDIPKVGDQFVFNAAGRSVLIVRAQDGQLRAFLNICPHRGAPLVEGCKQGRRMTCPFHAWTFDLEGNLVGRAREEGFAGQKRPSLISVPVAEWNGMVFVRAKPRSEKLQVEDFLGPLGERLSYLELERAEPVATLTLRVKANWKLAWNTFMEFYHFPALHPTSVGRMFPRASGIYDLYGNHGRMNYLAEDDFNSWHSRDEAEWPDRDYNGTHFLFPNSIVSADTLIPGKRFCAVYRIFPGEKVDEAVSLMSAYAPGGGISEAERKELAELHRQTMKVVADEDYVMVEKIQSNLKHAPPADDFMYGRNEVYLQQFCRAVCELTG